MPAAMLQGKPGILHDINLGQSTLQPEPHIVGTLEPESMHTSSLPPHCGHFLSAIQRHIIAPFIQAVDSILKQDAAWRATNNTVKGFSIFPQNWSSKSKPNPIPPTYLKMIPPSVSSWTMPTRGTRHLVRVMYHRSLLKTCTARTMRHSQPCLWQLQH